MNIVAIFPLIVGQNPIDNGVSWDVVTLASMNTVLQPNVMDTWEEVECVPGPIGWRIVSRRHSQDSWIIQRRFVNEGVGKDGDSVDGWPIIRASVLGKLPCILVIHLTIDVHCEQ